MRKMRHGLGIHITQYMERDEVPENWWCYNIHCMRRPFQVIGDMR